MEVKEGMIVLATSYYMGERNGRKISKITKVTKAQFEVGGVGKFWIKNMESVGKNDPFNRNSTTIQIITDEERKQLSDEFKRNNRINKLKSEIPTLIKEISDLEKLEEIYNLINK